MLARRRNAFASGFQLLDQRPSSRNLRLPEFGHRSRADRLGTDTAERSVQSGRNGR